MDDKFHRRQPPFVLLSALPSVAGESVEERNTQGSKALMDGDK